MGTDEGPGEAVNFPALSWLDFSSARMTFSNKHRRWLVFGSAVVVPLAIIALAYVTNCWRAHVMLRREIADIQNRGEAAWFADLAPPVGDEAVVRGKAITRFLNGFTRVPSEFLDQAVTRPMTDEEAIQLRQLVDGYRSDMQAILGLLRQGECRFEYDYQTREPYDILLPHVQNLRNVQRLLLADLHANLQKGDRQEAIRKLIDMLDLEAALQHDPFSVSQRVRKALANMALDAVQAAMAQEILREQDLTPLGERLKSMESGFRLADCVRAERALMLVTMENLGRPAMTRSLTDAARDISPRQAAVLNYWWGSWPYRPRRLYEEAVMLRTMSEFARLVDQPGRAASQRHTAVLDQIGEEDFPIFHECSLHIGNLREAGLLHRQRLISAQHALKIYVYRAIHGYLPESLEDIQQPSPGISSVGLLSDKPLMYEKSADGFAIYDELPEQGRFEVKFARALNEH